jgi:16S rRNA U516 pseudouridylate synthase RsuA-like enzyme
VNGKVACIGDSIDIQTDRVEIGDKVVKDQEEYVYYKMNKPRGIITTCAEF